MLVISFFDNENNNCYWQYMYALPHMWTPILLIQLKKIKQMPLIELDAFDTGL